jgi:phage baseplate assembly protein gpV
MIFLTVALTGSLLSQSPDTLQKVGYWTDERTKLTWAAADNGSGVTVSQARHYCKLLRAGGFNNWRLPSIDELSTIFGSSPDQRGFRVIVPLKLSGWAWSSTQGKEPAENWAFDFADGARASVAAGDAGLNRALCVR